MHGLKACSTPVTMRCGDSALGGLAVAVAYGEVIGVCFGHRTADAAARALAKRIDGYDFDDAAVDDVDRDEQLAEETLARLQRYAAGEPDDLSDIPAAISHLSPFQRRVAKACRAIKRGERRSYGELAAAVGSPGAARAVGQVMRNNRVPLIIPCHRVVAADGGLGGFSSPQGLAMKSRLLEMEAGGK